MAPRWFKNDENTTGTSDGNGTGTQAREDVRSIEIKPEVISAAVKPDLDNLRTEFTNNLNEKLKPVEEFFAAQNRQRDEQRRKDQTEAETPDDLEFISNPQSAVDKKLAPIIRQQQAANALLMINETLGDMDYYKSDPDFKAKVMSKINAQPMALRSNVDIIMNCYKLVAYDEREAIKEGKYKSILGAASTSGTGGHTGTNSSKDDEVTMSDEEKHYAKKMGIDEKDWIKSKKTLEYV